MFPDRVSNPGPLTYKSDALPIDYDTKDVVSIDMKVCYPASFQDMGEEKPYFERIGHQTHRMTRVAINGALPRDTGTGFTEVLEWEFEAICHPVIPARFSRLLRRCRLDLDPCVLHKVWPAEVSQSHRNDHLF